MRDRAGAATAVENGHAHQSGESEGVRHREPMYWKIGDVQFHCRIGRSTAWRLVREEGFPPPVLFGKRTILWPREEVIEFLDQKRDPAHYGEPASDAVVRFSTRPLRRS
jgi:predicted DNA-binding transcriptional regulator AlpA